MASLLIQNATVSLFTLTSSCCSDSNTELVDVLVVDDRIIQVVPHLNVAAGQTIGASQWHVPCWLPPLAVPD